MWWAFFKASEELPVQKQSDLGEVLFQFFQAVVRDMVPLSPEKREVWTLDLREFCWVARERLNWGK